MMKGWHKQGCLDRSRKKKEIYKKFCSTILGSTLMKLKNQCSKTIPKLSYQLMVEGLFSLVILSSLWKEMEMISPFLKVNPKVLKE